MVVAFLAVACIGFILGGMTVLVLTDESEEKSTLKEDLDFEKKLTDEANIKKEKIQNDYRNLLDAHKKLQDTNADLQKELYIKSTSLLKIKERMKKVHVIIEDLRIWEQNQENFG